MQVIDHRGQRENERFTLNSKLREMQEAWLLKEQEKRDRIISFTTDWVVEDVYIRATSGQVVINACIEQVQDENKSKFLKYALDNRNNLETIVIKDHETQGYGRDKIISIESDMETINKLHQEARKLNLEYEEYVRAVYYTAALNIINKREVAKIEAEERIKRTQLIDISLTITAELRGKLEAKYGEPQYDRGVMNFKIYDHGDMLIDLAKEYFKLK